MRDFLSSMLIFTGIYYIVADELMDNDINLLKILKEFNISNSNKLNLFFRCLFFVLVFRSLIYMINIKLNSYLSYFLIVLMIIIFSILIFQRLKD